MASSVGWSQNVVGLTGADGGSSSALGLAKVYLGEGSSSLS